MLQICCLIIYNLIILLSYFRCQLKVLVIPHLQVVKKKGRGPNQINFNKIAKAKEIGITFNQLGQPLGDSSIALSKCIGIITTQMIPITYSSWPEVPDVVKDSVWETMKVIKIPAEKKTKEEATANRDSESLYFWRAKKSVESGDLEDTEVDRVETWIAGHKYKDGTLVTEDAEEIIKQLEGIYGNQATSISDDAVSQVLGKEHRGRVRGLGGGVTPTRVNASVVGKQTTTQLREEMKK
ncbi:hypothetical protein ACOSQ4_005667 [Xanthoceras sorbifolium]